VPGVALITGAAGFAGSHLVERLAAAGLDVHALGHGSGGASVGAPGVRWQEVDVLDREALTRIVSAVRPDTVYHCAGLAHVHDAWADPARWLRINVMGTHNLLQACRDAGIAPRVLVTGSALVYRAQRDALTEDAPIAPPNPYGVSKLAQEMTAAASGLPVLLTRPFNHAGPRQAPTFATSAFAQQIARIEAGRAEPVLRVGNLEARRDVTDVRDTVRAYHALVERGVPGRAYNVCSGQAHSMRELLDLLLARARVRVRIEVDPERLRPSDNPVILGSHARLTADTGWTPAIPIEQTMADLLDYWRAREAAA
jgi:GDP-4-dehydro-6-deoxy-D-mannose reductase